MIYNLKLKVMTRISAGPEVIFAELGDEVSLLCVQTGVYYSLNSLGAAIWRKIQQSKTLAEIKSELIEEYEVDEVRCESDLIRIVGDLRNHGLVETDEP